jgi:predicted ArsR family transcriptional regulator
VSYRQSIKQEILELLKEEFPHDFSIGEIAKQVGVVRSTTSTWLKVLSAEGKIGCQEKWGNSIFYRFKGEFRCSTFTI